MTTTIDPELALLERVREAEQASGHLTQRELSRSVGLSLGMTNLLVRRLVERGWLALTRHSSKSISYLLTPQGSAALLKRGVGYFGAASRLAATHAVDIEAFVIDAKRGGATGVILVGSSSADFLLERACEIHELVFLRSADPERWTGSALRPGLALAWGERCDSAGTLPEGEVRLLDLRRLLGQGQDRHETAAMERMKK
jgi:hypothetical protein